MVGLNDYCPMHIEGDGDKVRIPCPIDPKHTIFEADLDKHVLICSKTKDVAFIKSQKLYHENVNLTPGKVENCSLQGFSVSAEVAEFWGKKIELALARLSKGVDYSTHFDVCEIEGDKHKLQNEQIVKAILNLKVISSASDKFCVAEFGCGKGGLASCLMQESLAKTWKFLLIDREARRNKAENRNREIESVRLRLDLKDTDLSLINSDNVFSVDLTSMIVCAKHLCGSATDLTLLAVKRSPVPVSLCIATCCHHACDWNVFVGRELFTEIALCSNAEEFMIIRLLSSWATSTDGTLSPEKIRIGRTAKHVIDLSRCLWIKSNLNDKVTYGPFIDVKISPENYLILAD